MKRLLMALCFLLSVALYITATAPTERGLIECKSDGHVNVKNIVFSVTRPVDYDELGDAFDAVARVMCRESQLQPAHNLKSAMSKELDLPYWEELKRLRSDNARMRAAILDIIERWPTERGMDGALSRARALIMDDALRNPDKDDVKRALEQKAP